LSDKEETILDKALKGAPDKQEIVFGQSDLLDIEHYRRGGKGQAAVSQDSRIKPQMMPTYPNGDLDSFRSGKEVILLIAVILAIAYWGIYSGFHDLCYAVIRYCP
jgi:hypothetical protein